MASVTGTGMGTASRMLGDFRPEDAHEMLVEGLRNAHGMEQQAIEMLERNVERLEHYSALKARLARHLEESREQQQRVADALERLGESSSTLKDTVMGLAQNMQMMMHAAAGDEVIKNSFAGFAFEHFEIAAYSALAIIAQAAGESEIAQMANDICQQEQEMADWLRLHLPEVVQEHLALMRTGDQKH